MSHYYRWSFRSLWSSTTRCPRVSLWSWESIRSRWSCWSTGSWISVFPFSSLFTIRSLRIETESKVKIICLCDSLLVPLVQCFQFLLAVLLLPDLQAHQYYHQHLYHPVMNNNINTVFIIVLANNNNNKRTFVLIYFSSLLARESRDTRQTNPTLHSVNNNNNNNSYDGMSLTVGPVSPG